MSRKLFSLSLNGQGHHPGSWRLPQATRERAASPDFIRELAAEADAAGLDFLVVEYPLRSTALPGRNRQEAVHFDALSVAASLSGVTRHIGLVAPISSVYSEPFNIARQFTAFDHLSRGRAGWLFVPSLDEADCPNFNRLDGTDGAFHDARSAEFAEVALALFDSWEDEALALDKQESIFAHPGKIHVIDHQGAHFSINTSMNAPRPPQGHPVVLMAPSSAADEATAAARADVVLLSGGREEVAARGAGLKRLAVAAGRTHLKVFADLAVTLAEAGAAAKALAGELDRLGPPIGGVEHFVGTAVELAVYLETWDCDGFNLMPSVLPGGLSPITAGLLPLLRERGIAAAAPANSTLRERLGLHRPAGRRS